MKSRLIQLSTSGNSARSVSISKLASSYAITENLVETWQLKSIACSGDTDGRSVVNVPTRSVTIDLDSGEAITCVFTSVRDEDYVLDRTKRVIRNFISRRGDQITANEPDLASRLGGGTLASSNPVGFAAEGTLSENTMSLATSLRQIAASGHIAKAKRQQDLLSAMSLGQQSLATSGFDPTQPGLDIWVQAKWAHVDSETRNTDLGLLYAGVEYRALPSLIVGFLGQVDWSEEQDKNEDIAADGIGWMAGPYVVARLHENLIFDGRAAWGKSDNHVNPLGLYSDSFETNRWLIRGQLTGDFSLGNWRLAPHVGVIYFEDSQDAYTDSLGITIPGQIVSLGRMTFGPRISYNFTGDDGTIISPHISLKGSWDFDKALIVDLDTGVPGDTGDDLRGRIEGGISARFSNGWSVNGQGFYDGIGSDLTGFAGSTTLRVPLN